MRYFTSLTLNLASTLFCLLSGFVTMEAAKDCHGQVCQAVVEFCSTFAEGCDKCSNICDETSHNFHADTCARQCSEYNKFDPLSAEIHAIQTQQRIILILLILLLALIVVRYAYKCIRWMRHRRCVTLILKKLHPKQMHGAATGNVKDLTSGGGGATTIQNVMTINETERAPSQIYSVTGAEGSVMTMTTPVSTRYPAENSTTPTTTITTGTDHSYDNQALAVTPVSEKPSGTQAF